MAVLPRTSRPHPRLPGRLALALLIAVFPALVPASARALAAPPAHAAHGGGGDGHDERDEREHEDQVESLLARMTSFLHRREVGGITPDPRMAINPSEANRLSVVSQLLGFNQMARLHPSQVMREDVITRADFLVDHFDELTSGGAFDGMTGYALLGAYEITHDPRHLAAGKRVVDRSMQLYGWNNTLNWGLMSALALSKYYALTGDVAARDKTLEILASLRPYQNLDGSFPHYCPGSVDIHYTAWMSMELLIVRRWVPSPMIDQYLAGTRRFLEQCVDSVGLTQYQVPCPSCPGGWRYRFGRRSGCIIDYDTRGWVNELGYSSLLFGEVRSPLYATVLSALRGMESAGAFADKWDYPPDTWDPIYPWATANPSVIRTSVIFWSLAELQADLRAPQLAQRGDDDDHERGGDDRDLALRSPGTPAGVTGETPAGGLAHAAWPQVYSADSLVLAVVMGHELGAPILSGAGGAGDLAAPGDLPRRGLDRDGASAARGSQAPASGVVSETRLARVTPNPTRSGCEVAFELAREGETRLEIFDVSGRRVRTLESGPLAAGEHRAVWDGRNALGAMPGAGLYFVALTTADGRRVARLVISP